MYVSESCIAMTYMYMFSTSDVLSLCLSDILTICCSTLCLHVSSCVASEAIEVLRYIQEKRIIMAAYK